MAKVKIKPIGDRVLVFALDPRSATLAIVGSGGDGVALIERLNACASAQAGKALSFGA